MFHYKWYLRKTRVSQQQELVRKVSLADLRGPTPFPWQGRRPNLHGPGQGGEGDHIQKGWHEQWGQGVLIFVDLDLLQINNVLMVQFWVIQTTKCWQRKHRMCLGLFVKIVLIGTSALQKPFPEYIVMYVSGLPSFVARSGRRYKISAERKKV